MVYGSVLQWVVVRVLHFIQRTVKRLHLSKVKTTKYYDSGCLAVFYFISLVWGVDIILSCGYATNPTLLWREYPHTLMRCAVAVVQGVEMKCFPPTLSLQFVSEVFYADTDGILAALLSRAYFHQNKEGCT